MANPHLQKSLKPLHVGALALGCIIGWGCFVLPGDFLAKSGPLGAAIGLFLGAALMVVITRSYGLMIARFPVAGAEFAYAYYACGRYHATICGWFLTLGYLSIIPLNATALALLGKFVAPSLFARGFLYRVAGFDVYLGEVALASAAIILVGYFNFRSVRSVGDFQLVLTLLLVGTVLIVAVGTLFAPTASLQNWKPFFAPGRSSLSAILGIVALAPWLYVGFDTIPQASEELAFSPSRTFRLMVLAIFAGAAMYLAMTLATASIEPWRDLLSESSAWITGTTVRHSLGLFGFALLGIAVTTAIFTGLNGFYLAASRLLFGMGRAKLLPAWFGAIHPEHGTPHRAIFFAGLLSLLAPWFGRKALLWVVDMSALGTAFGYAYTCFAAWVLLRDEGTGSSGPWTKLLALGGTIASLGFVVLLTVPGMPAFMSTPSWIALAGWVALGMVFFAARTADYRHMSKRELDEAILGTAQYARAPR
jgi:amino acid transporter